MSRRKYLNDAEIAAEMDLWSDEDSYSSDDNVEDVDYVPEHVPEDDSAHDYDDSDPALVTEEEVGQNAESVT